MSNFFNLKRFGAYSRKQYTENRKIYLFGAVLIVLAIACGFWIAKQESFPNDLHPTGIIHQAKAIAAALFVLAFSTLFFLQWSTREWRSSSKNVLCTLTPASNFEKYGFVWLNSMILLPLFFGLVLWAVHGLFGMFYEYTDIFAPRDRLLTLVLVSLFGHALALFLFTAIRKHALLVYVILIAFFIIYFAWLPTWLEKQGVLDTYSEPMPFYTAYPMRTADFSYDISRIGANIRPTVDLLLALFVTGIFWTAGFFRFKEKQLK